ncbi:MAG: acyclic terpene utilization AtuA family protein [Ilumatobacteraceae bacterium]
MNDRPVIIANCSGFYGDRLSAAREMVEGGPIDVLTGDWLAELTMLILWKAKARNADGGYANTFLTQMEQVLGTCADRGIKVVTNAGGLNPAGCAAKVREIAERVGVRANVAHVEGDDVVDRIDGLRPHLANLDTGEPLTASPVSANAYLGGWGIARALAEGADVVVCPRVTDAAVVVGPAAWWWGWAPTDWDRLAGAVTAGHVIECGAQTTGGNFAFFEELGDRSRPLGFPIAEVDRDGSSVITKHPGTGGRLTVDTVTAQLLYEIQTPSYANPDVVTRFDTVQVTEVGPDRVRISDVRGEPAPASAKVAINYEGGFRNKMTFVLTGLDQEGKAQWAGEALVTAMGGEDRLREAGLTMERRFVPAPSDGADQERSSGLLHVQVKAPDERAVGRAFSSAAVELALASYPGFFTTSPPGPATSFGVYWPALVPADEIDQVVVLEDGTRLRIEPAPTGPASEEPISPPVIEVEPATIPAGTPLGAHFGARSGDKGGNANVGVWARDDAGYAWLRANLTTERIRELIPEAGDRPIHRYELPNLRALNFVLVGYLGEGVASSTSFDPQAKGLGEYLRSRPA